MRKTFPKEGIKKLKQTIKDLKAQINELEKENRFLKGELVSNIEVEESPKPPANDHEQRRKDFLKRIKEDR